MLSYGILADAWWWWLWFCCCILSTRTLLSSDIIKYSIRNRKIKRRINTELTDRDEDLVRWQTDRKKSSLCMCIMKPLNDLSLTRNNTCRPEMYGRLRTNYFPELFTGLGLFNNCSPKWKWIIVLLYTKLVNSQRQKHEFHRSKLGWKGDYSRARPLCFANQWNHRISRAWVANRSARKWVFIGLPSIFPLVYTNKYCLYLS